ncbi:MAG: YdeI/OmpD-associated family protein [Candidatus Hadarchaeota archaeon]
MIKFVAEIRKKGINPYVDVPKRVSESFGRKGYVPVKGTINRTSIRATLVPVGSGRHVLYVNTEIRKNVMVDVGDSVAISLGLDTEPRVVPMPDEFKLALPRNKKAKMAFDKLPPSHQREYLNYLNSLKTPESLKINTTKVIKKLLD